MRARRVLLSAFPQALQPKVLDRLIANISTLASVYHQVLLLALRSGSAWRESAGKVPEAFCDNNRVAWQAEEPDEFEACLGFRDRSSFGLLWLSSRITPRPLRKLSRRSNRLGGKRVGTKPGRA